MGRWGYDRDDDSDGKPLRHLVLAERTRKRVRANPSPRHQPDNERKREKQSKTPSRSYVRLTATEIMDAVRELVLDDPSLRPDEIAKEMNRRHGVTPSIITVSNIRTQFRGTLRFLKTRGLLKRIPEKREIGRRNAD